MMYCETHKSGDITNGKWCREWSVSFKCPPYCVITEWVARSSSEGAAMNRRVAVDDVKPTKSKDLPWTWENEASNIKTRQCLCCGLPGHYQEMLESYMADHGTDGLAIVVDDDGYVGDGHHRVVAALNLGITHLPVETKEDAQARWVRDHGYVDWHNRKAGDR